MCSLDGSHHIRQLVERVNLYEKRPHMRVRRNIAESDDTVRYNDWIIGLGNVDKRLHGPQGQCGLVQLRVGGVVD